MLLLVRHHTELFDCTLQPPTQAGSSLAGFSILKMEAIRSSETSVQTRPTRRHIPEDGILLFDCFFTAVVNVKTLKSILLVIFSVKI
jgi:hypothetical protein